MKKLFVIILCLTGGVLFAQTGSRSGPSVRLNGYATYAFDDKNVNSYYSDNEYFEGSILGGFEYGGGLEVMVNPAYGLEISYLRLDSEAPVEYYNDGVQFTTFNLAHNYIFIGGNRYMKVNPKVEPYGGFQVGMAVYNVENPENSNSGSATKFAWGCKLGANIWVNEKVGLKLQAQLLSAVQAMGGSVYFGTGGAGAGVSGFSTYYQFNLGGGLVFNLGNR
jgi:hypothetical protein